MARQKYYAVKIGRNPGIYQNWSDCNLQIKNYSGAEYKSFTTLEEATSYFDAKNYSNNDKNNIEDLNNDIEEKICNLNDESVIAFVDGSYCQETNKAGYGVIIIDNNHIQTKLYKVLSESLEAEMIKLKNVAAEIEAAKQAIEWAIKYNKKNIYIYYDYSGIEKWATNEWKANTNITQKYATFISEKKSLINICFEKITAHSGIRYNEEVDKLAKISLLEKGYKTNNDGSIYFSAFGINNWTKLIENLKLEQKDFIDINNNGISYEKNEYENRTKLIVKDTNNKITINCYKNGNSYVQGKQSALLEIIISSAIECLEDKSTVIEILNHFHVLTITQQEVEMKFEVLLPHFKDYNNKKHYNNLLSAVYNTMLVGYMPDYTALVTPIFRAYEFCLHRILGDYLNLTTSKKNGTNNFSYFDKDSNGYYKCNSLNISKLTNDQTNLLNDIYNEYNRVRHQYSHWSSDDYETAIISNINIAKEYINKGLNFVDNFYKYF